MEKVKDNKKQIEILEHVRYVLGQPQHDDYNAAQYFESTLPMHILEGDIELFGEAEWNKLDYAIDNFTGDLEVLQ
jgi:hypothetical protein